MIVCEDVSKFYGEVLGVNRISLSIGRGVTSLVGPNGSGKTTLMNLITGLLQPTRGRISVFGVSPTEPEKLFRRVGYCPLFDSFPKGLTGREFVRLYLGLHGFSRARADALTEQALERVGMTEAAGRRVDGYSKGMRQRIRLAQAVAHEPEVLLLDEPLNGLDPLARAEIIRLFRQFADAGMCLLISSHILHEVDLLSDSVIALHHGYAVAEGTVAGLRGDITRRPSEITVRCRPAHRLAARLLAEERIVEARLHDDGDGVTVKTFAVEAFYEAMQRIVATRDVHIDAVAPSDDDLGAVYQYLLE
jgi:ABC-2 type transport system ATP-binding protein